MALQKTYPARRTTTLRRIRRSASRQAKPLTIPDELLPENLPRHRLDGLSPTEAITLVLIAYGARELRPITWSVDGMTCSSDPSGVLGELGFRFLVLGGADGVPRTGDWGATHLHVTPAGGILVDPSRSRKLLAIADLAEVIALIKEECFGVEPPLVPTFTPDPVSMFLPPSPGSVSAATPPKPCSSQEDDALVSF
jgi:hypothetical protein